MLVASLSVVAAQSVAPLGLVAPVPSGTVLTVSGSGLATSFVFTLVSFSAAVPATCASHAASMVVATTVDVATATSSQLLISLNSAISAAASSRFLVCVQYASDGAPYQLTDPVLSLFSVITIATVAPTQYAFVASKALAVTGTALSSADLYYAVGFNQLCTGTKLGNISVSISSVTDTTASLTVTFAAGSSGTSYRLCVRPGGNPLDALAGTVSNGQVISAITVSSVTPLTIPALDGASVTILGSGFPLGSDMITVKVAMHFLISCCALSLISHTKFRFFLVHHATPVPHF